jgi:hypothetical protein
MGVKSMRLDLKRSGCDCRDRDWIFCGMEVLEYCRMKWVVLRFVLSLVCEC